jgi:hypothetical protein
MSEKNEITTVNPDMPQMSGVSFDNINQGTVAVESHRAIAEAQGKLVIAKRFPRDEFQAFADMKKACQRPGLASKAFYSYPRGGETISGPTIRLAEELARCWRNIEYGIKELSQDNGKSEMQAFAWDLEANTMSVQNFTNPHAREVKSKGQTTIKQLTSLRDIYENNANMAGRRLRARILAVLPADFVEEAIAECKKTLAGKNDTPLVDRVRNMIVQFEKLGVTREMIEKRLSRSIDTMNATDLTDYVGIFNSLKDGQTKISDWFEYTQESDLTAKLKEVL